MLEIREVLTNKEQKIFATFPTKLYQKVSQAIPDLISDEMDNFHPEKNPAYEYCKVKQFLAYKDGVEYAETGPELENNHQVQALWKYYEAKQHKRRRCFVKSLE